MRFPQGRASVNRGGQTLRSGFEVGVTDELVRRNIPYEYEALRIPYTPPQKVKHYTPDIILPNGIIVEIKGRFVPADRQKHKMIKAQYPDLDIRFVFQRASQKISRVSNTSYGDWCKGNGIPYAETLIPLAWVKEPINLTNLSYIEGWRKK